MVYLDGVQHSAENNQTLVDACKMALHNLRLPFVRIKNHKEVNSLGNSSPTNSSEASAAQLTKDVVHRSRVINEILSTEKQYVENLLVIVKVYMEPLEQQPKLLSRDERVKIFSIVETLATLHSAFLQKLEKVSPIWY
tara:strand:- start:327 stop:740 length:414 start_codon:yes stop_codon:yes gene_type:complete